ncbi:MAG: ParA family partition ATPase [Azospirillaceae bacterium]
MAARVITIAQQKGGAGKTTLTAHLAVGFGEAGLRVAVLDIDPQGSLSAWAALRGGQPPEHRQAGGWRTASEVDKLRRDFDLILIDSPPHAETEAKLAVREADIVIVPVQPSPMDIWATKPTLDLARAEGREVLVVLNRVPPRARLVDLAREKLAELDVAVMDATLGNRVGFAAALMEGRAVTEEGRQSAAAQEIQALVAELRRRLAI